MLATTPKMPTTEIPSEVWIHIISFLRNPTPVPMSSPPRSAIMQPHLACAARVSKLFQSAAESLLYTHITTDQPLNLCFGDDKTTKLAKLSLVKTLRIEYVSKYEKTTYVALCRRGDAQWERCGLMQDDEDDDDETSLKRRMERDICSEEMGELVKFTRKLKDMGTGKVFPHLQTVAVSSIFGGHYWGECKLASKFKGIDNLLLCMNWFDMSLTRSNVKDLCLRSMQGPLNMPISRHPDFPNTLRSRTVHFPPRDLHVPMPFGIPIKWLSEADSNSDDAGGLYSPEYNIARGVGEALRARMKAQDFMGTVNLEIHSWTSLPRIDKRDIAELQASMQKELDGLLEQYRRKGSETDSIRYHLSLTPPVCNCCGTGVN